MHLSTYNIIFADFIIHHIIFPSIKKGKNSNAIFSLINLCELHTIYICFLNILI